MTACSFGAFTNSITSKPNADWWTGQTPNFDPAWAWAKEVETLLGGSDGTTGFDNILYNPTTQPTSTTGRLYYDSAGNVFKYYNSSDWVTIEAGIFTVSLDDAYNVGQAITVDAGTLTFTATDAANNDVMALVQADATGGTSVLTLTNAGTGATLEFDGNSTGNDVLGSDSTWGVTETGLGTLAGLTIAAGDVLFDATAAGKDVNWDDSEETLGLLDDAVLGFGNTAAAPDVEVSWNASNLIVNSKTEDTGEIQIGPTNAIDFVLYGNTNSKTAGFNANTATLEFNDYDLQMQDTDVIAFGDGDDWTVASPSAKKVKWTPATGDGSDSFDVGANTAGADFQLFGADTSGATALFDSDGDLFSFNAIDLLLQDGDQLQFGDAPDITVAFDGGNGVLDILGSGLEISFGVTDEGIDVVWHGEAAGDHMKWDEGIDTLLFEDSHIKLDDDAVMYVGTKTNNQTLDGDFKMESSSDTSWVFTAVVANSEITIGDGTIATDFRLNNITTAGADFWFDQSADTAAGTIFIGVDGKGIDTKFFGDAASSYVLWDQSGDQLNAVDADVVLDDESLFVDIIDTTGTKVEVGTPFYVIFKPTAEEDLAYVVPAAYDLLVIDAWGYKTAGAGANALDEWLLTNDEGGAAAIFAQVELIGVGDGDRVAFTDLDDAEAEVEGGQTMTLNADENAGNGCDGIIVVSCTLKIAD